MSDPVYPPSLPAYPLRDGLEWSPPMLTVDSEMDSGPPLSRKFQSGGATPPFAVQTKVQTLALRDVLQDFWLNSLAAGSLPFTWAGLSSVTGGGTGRFRIVGQPKYRPAGATRWLITMNIIRLP